jgi:hypothetical protein
VAARLDAGAALVELREARALVAGAGERGLLESDVRRLGPNDAAQTFVGSAVWTVASLGAAPGDVLPGESSGDDINDDLRDLRRDVSDLVDPDWRGRRVAARDFLPP